jgi:hypothetical protein
MMLVYSLLMEPLILLASPGPVVFPAQPRIDRIELFGTNAVTLHFDTQANKTYSLQFIDSLSCAPNLPFCGSMRVPADGWSNLFVAPNFPFANHYVIVDTRTNGHRFYRLTVTD